MIKDARHGERDVHLVHLRDRPFAIKLEITSYHMIPLHLDTMEQFAFYNCKINYLSYHFLLQKVHQHYGSEPAQHFLRQLRGVTGITAKSSFFVV